MSGKTIALVGLGSNLGDPVAAVRHALQALDAIPGTRLVRASRLYRTPAWGRTDQPDFINAVAMLETTLAPRELLDAMLGIELDAGRERRPEERWGPRTLDLDLLLYGDARIDEPGLHVPHPHLHERVFALLPLADIAPDAVIPGVGAVRDALACLRRADIEPIS